MPGSLLTQQMQNVRLRLAYSSPVISFHKNLLATFGEHSLQVHVSGTLIQPNGNVVQKYEI